MFHRFKWSRTAEERIRILRAYEPLQPFLLLELARTLQADTFIDVGANIGAYSLLMSSLDCVRKVHAFEPSPETFFDLSQNIQLNQLQGKVVAHNIAVSDANKSAAFGIISDYSGANSIIDTSIHETTKFEKRVTVKCAMLDSFLKERSHRVCVKIDVEGHEEGVLRGAHDLLTGNRGIVQVEHYKNDDQALPDLLMKYDYVRILKIGPDHYFTNSPEHFSDKSLLRIFERSGDELVKCNLQMLEFQEGAFRPIKLRISRDFSIEISGGAAEIARKIRTSFGRDGGERPRSAGERHSSAPPRQKDVSLINLPPDSPDLNAIKKVSAMLKQLLFRGRI